MLSTKLRTKITALPRTSTDPAPEPLPRLVLAVALDREDVARVGWFDAVTTNVDVEGSWGVLSGVLVLSAAVEVDINSGRRWHLWGLWRMNL